MEKASYFLICLERSRIEIRTTYTSQHSVSQMVNGVSFRYELILDVCVHTNTLCVRLCSEFFFLFSFVCHPSGFCLSFSNFFMNKTNRFKNTWFPKIFFSKSFIRSNGQTVKPQLPIYLVFVFLITINFHLFFWYGLRDHLHICTHLAPSLEPETFRYLWLGYRNNISKLLSQVLVR